MRYNKNNRVSVLRFLPKERKAASKQISSSNYKQRLNRKQIMKYRVRHFTNEPISFKKQNKTTTIKLKKGGSKGSWVA